jgi:predicted PurR-regulated permease PerM
MVSRRRKQVLYLCCVGILILQVAYYLRAIVNPLLVSLLIAYMLHPLICFFDRWKINRTFVIVGLYGIFFSLFSAFFVFGIPEIYTQMKQLSFEFMGERSTDLNNNGKRDEGEPFNDKNKNNYYDKGEIFEDLNQNGIYDSPELFTDVNLDQMAQNEELFEDLNQNKIWDKGYLHHCLSQGKKIVSQFNQKLIYHLLQQSQIHLEQTQKALQTLPQEKTSEEKEFLLEQEKKFQQEIHNFQTQIQKEDYYYQQLLSDLQDHIYKHQDEIASQGIYLLQFSLESFFLGLESILVFLTYLILMPIYVFFFARGMDKIWNRIVAYLPGKHRSFIVEILLEIHQAVSSFFHGRIIIFFLVACGTTFGLLIIQVKFALLLGIITGLGIMIPFLSVIIGFLPALGLLYFTDGSTSTQILSLCILFTLVMGITQFFLEPIILGKKVNIHPVTILVSFFIGGKLFGFFGVLCAVPLASIVKILLVNLVLPSLKELAEDDGEEKKEASPSTPAQEEAL